MLKRLAAFALFAAATPALAGAPGDIARDSLYAGTLQVGLDGISAAAAQRDPEAMFGTGVLTFAQAVESFAQALYRHGLAAPNAGPMAPLLSMPIPPNPHPEPLDYAGVRLILANLVSDLDSAATAFEAAGEGGDYVVKIVPFKIRIDINGDGRADDSETIGNVLAAALGVDPNPRPQIPTDVPDTGGLKQDRSLGTAPAPVPPTEAGVGFDRADALWLAGYSNVIAAQADLLLAHDFSETVNVAFHRLFPQAGFPMQEFSTGGQLILDPESDNAISDFIAAIHTINWPVVEPERLKRVLTRFSTITALSRKNWAALLEETDDNAELVPSPRQTGLSPDAKVTAEMAAAWMATLDTADQIIAGKLLVPHWRFKQGFDLKAYFETATRTDLVMLLTGYGALPFLKDGPIASADSFRAANEVFGDQFLGYAFWFN